MLIPSLLAFPSYPRIASLLLPSSTFAEVAKDTHLQQSRYESFQEFSDIVIQVRVNSWMLDCNQKHCVHDVKLSPVLEI